MEEIYFIPTQISLFPSFFISRTGSAFILRAQLYIAFVPVDYE